MSMPNRCEVPHCDNPPEFEAPGYWCKGHWRIWWFWDELRPREPEPEWMKAGKGGVYRVE